jgi:phosphoglycerate dehydrogenase-like enzyme
MQRTTRQNTKLTICVWHPFSQWRPTAAMADTIRARFPEMKVVHLPDYERLPEELPDTDIFAGFSLRANQLKDAKKLKWIHATAAGVAQLTYPELRESGILVTNSSGIYSLPMAEHTMGLMIALARSFPESVRHQMNRHWGQQDIWDLPQRLTELNGKLLLIVGYGSIGRELAKRAKAFEMRVWGVTRSGRGETSFVERIFSKAQLGEALPDADYVVIAAPETEETKQLIGVDELKRMKRGTRLINVARGSLLDEAALMEALESGQLSGAALDVASEEPLPKENPLWKAPNLFITPHTSAVSDRLWERQTELFVRLLERWFDGGEMFNRVDLSRGY